ncbi:hypothetical protein AGMMS50255_1240 [Spirochaetia bacterium]|nr:hypothetical protein AGMMS50255_1240 [Spirochaetia bacterium]
MKLFAVLGVCIMLVMLLGSVMLAENMFLGTMADATETVTPEHEPMADAATELQNENAAEPENNRRFAGYSGIQIDTKNSRVNRENTNER